VEWFSADYLKFLISTYGYWAVGLIVCLESMGLPLPGEAVLVIASLYAGRHQDLHIAGVVAAAATGAVLGDNIGYLLGREFGYRLLLRYGGNVGLSYARIKLGQYLFARHGGKVVFLGRFVALLRVMAAFLAGMNRMDWRHFLLANAAGGILWAAVFGLGAHTFGKVLLQASAPLAAGLLLIGTIAVVASALFVRRHEADLEAEAERAMPGPLQPVHSHKRLAAIASTQQAQKRR
jgi:membrane protein DedA with SNARE-associated domain